MHRPSSKLYIYSNKLYFREIIYEMNQLFPKKQIFNENLKKILDHPSENGGNGGKRFE